MMKRGRLFTFYLIGRRNVTYRDITIRDGASWIIRLTECQDVVIHDIRIHYDLKLPNNDSIDLAHCQNVWINVS
jgi:polygalacturonase